MSHRRPRLVPARCRRSAELGLLTIVLLAGCKGDPEVGDTGGPSDATGAADTAGSADAGGPGATGSSSAAGDSTSAGGSTGAAGSDDSGTDTGTGGVPSDCAPIDLGEASQTVTLPNGCNGPTCTSIGRTALIDLVGSEYLGVPGGLYCDSNERPAAYEAQGVALASSVEPLDSEGNADPDGRYALVSIGMSHTTQEFSRFIEKYADDPAINDELVIVDGALGGHATPQWLDPQNDAWTNLTMRLGAAGVSDAQVVALWVKLAQQQPQGECDAASSPGEPCFPAHAAKLAEDIRTILGMLATRFPNVKLVYLTNRSYAGYATSTLNPEPYAYQTGFSVKKLVLDKITEQPAAAALPYLAWGPYLWADGTNANGDGLSWTVDDFVASDGTHPSPMGRDKVADLLLEFFTTDSTAAPWFNAP